MTTDEGLKGMLAAGLATPVDQILSWRDRRGGRTTPDDDAPVVASLVDDGLDWDESLALLDEIRARFFHFDDATVQQRLARLDLKSFPGLKAPVGRLRETVRHRSVLLGLRQQLGATEFVDCVFEVLLSTPRQVGQIRDGWLAKSETNPTPATRNAVGIVKQIEQQAPDLYRLEQSWFEAIVRDARIKPSKWLGSLAVVEVESFFVGAVALGLAAVPWNLPLFAVLLVVLWIVAGISAIHWYGNARSQSTRSQ